MRARDIIICILALVLGVGLLIVAGSGLDYINTQRKEMNLVINEPLENAPPSLAFATVALGAFRGLIVDALWIRADTLKQKGQFFDARQLAEWIVTLQPRFSKVWEFHSWNMAYNISVAIPASQPEQRWQWVKNGYELLRDRGIPLNPTDIALYRQLAWTFQHKIGGITDDAHEYYKLQLAEAMQSLLGEADENFFQALADAPKQWNQIITDANIVEFVTELKAADPAFEDNKKFVGNYLALRQSPDKFKPEAFRVIDDYRGTKTLARFDIFAKAYRLRNEWKLEPELMQQINKTYGPTSFTDPNHHLPMDWRHPDVHAIYWAVKGLQACSKQEIDIDEANTDRIVNHSLQNLYRNGKIFIYKQTPPERFDDRSPGMIVTIYQRPDLRIFDSYDKSQLATIEKYKDRSGTYESMQGGHRNMLKNAVLSFYQAGHTEKATQIYNELRKLYPRDEFKVDLVTFVRNRLREELSGIGITDAKEIVQMMLRESYFKYAMHEDDEAAGLEKMAEEVRRVYMSE
ncbi:MAG: hypothetical protein PVG93_06795, partial [Phycisphaerales bacterium]